VLSCTAWKNKEQNVTSAAALANAQIAKAPAMAVSVSTALAPAIAHSVRARVSEKRNAWRRRSTTADKITGEQDCQRPRICERV
jgi:hypothetical protein